MKKLFFLFTLVFLLGNSQASAESKQVLDLQIQETLQSFIHQARGGKEFLDKTAGYLVIPNLYKAGFFVGGEYGEGGLVVHDPADPKATKIISYYSMLSASIGFQAGAQRRSLIIAFLTPDALRSFETSNKWKVGVDGSVAFVKWGGGIDLSTMDFKKPIVAFMFNNEGLMAGVSLDGSVFNKIQK